MEIAGINVQFILQVAVAVVGAYLAAFWLSLVIWTYRDIRSSSRDIVTQFLAVLLVLVFNVAGLMLYYILRPRETLKENYQRSLEEEALLQELDVLQACPTCKRRVEQDFVVCPICRTQLKQVCNHCHRLLNLNWAVCPYSGQPSGAASLSPSEASVSSNPNPKDEGSLSQ